MHFEFEEQERIPAVIKVIGLGGAGCNAVDGMIEVGLGNVEFIVANTDKQALVNTKTPNRVQMGPSETQGLGTGGKPEIGEKAAQESAEEIKNALSGAHMVFIAAGMGGGTGTGAAPVVAEIARSMKALTVAIVTKPFNFEGRDRSKVADGGIQRLRANVDALMVIPNDHLLQVVGEKTTLIAAFEIANKVLYQAISSVTDLIKVTGKINVDFSDIKSIVGNTGGAVIGIGTGKGEGRAEQAVRKAASSPLLEKNEIHGARRILLNVVGGQDITLFELSTISKLVGEMAHPDAQVRIGTVIDPELKDEIRVTLVATDFDGQTMASETTYYSPVTPRNVTPVMDPNGSAQVQEEEKKEELSVPEFEEDGQMNLIAAIEKSEFQDQEDKKESAPVEVDSNDMNIPAYLRRKGSSIL